MKKILLATTCFITSLTFASQAFPSRSTVSEAVGHKFGSMVNEAYDRGVDIEPFANGFQDFIKGKPFPFSQSQESQPSTELGFKAVGYLIGQTFDILLDADLPQMLVGFNNALAGLESPLDEEQMDELSFDLFKDQYKAFAKNIESTVALFELLDE